MNDRITSKELGMEIYRLTDWQPPFATYIGTEIETAKYDIGFLLQHISKSGFKLSIGNGGKWVAVFRGNRYSDQYPEEATGKLIIAMVKSGDIRV